MESGSNVFPKSTDLRQREFAGRSAHSVEGEDTLRTGTKNLPAHVRASVATRRGEYDARRLRSQRDIIRDVMLAAADCDTWMTLSELRALTRYGEASISAQLRHLRKIENGAYDVIKRHREMADAVRLSAGRPSECVWEYRVTRTAGN